MLSMLSTSRTALRARPAASSSGRIPLLQPALGGKSKSFWLATQGTAAEPVLAQQIGTIQEFHLPFIIQVVQPTNTRSPAHF